MIEIISIIGAWLICAIAAERAAEAITTSVFFSPLRQFLARISLLETYRQVDGTWPSVKYRGWMFSLTKTIGRWLSDLVSCGWCTSLWTSLFFSCFLPGKCLSYEAGDNLIVKTIALWGLANFYHAVFRLLHNGRVAAVDINLRIIDSESTEHNYGGTDGEFGERISQENTIGIEPPEV
jgi:hypothetical protein